MTTKLATMAALFAAACATGAGRRPEPTGRSTSFERAPTPAARHSPPARTPELDAENIERRFGFAEAKARREEKLRTEREASHQHDQLGVVDGPNTAVPSATGAKAAANAAPAAKPPCHCKTGAKAEH